MMYIEDKYQELLSTPSDINEHLPILRKYAEECRHITEMGVRGIVSTYALLVAEPDILISYDIKNCDWKPLREIAKEECNTDFQFILGNTLEVEIAPTDMLFIDTLHNYDQLSVELKLHAPKVRKYIILHDTTTYSYRGESYDGIRRVGLWPAIKEFLENNYEWSIKARFTNNNGLTILIKE
ncbi:MAG: hypothetical protein PF440_00240 [Thiomicrorhabdus sp.]|jgi:hypothetical protein|nr:hypothetical protein [Thiomicrorhabdus sp.]